MRVAVLELVHGHPGSSVVGGWARLELPAFVTADIEGHIGMVAGVAGVLEGRVGALGGGGADV